jgi:hypothetical protein
MPISTGENIECTFPVRSSLEMSIGDHTSSENNLQVEWHSRFVMVKVPSKDTATVVAALTPASKLHASVASTR